MINSRFNISKRGQIIVPIEAISSVIFEHFHSQFDNELQFENDTHEQSNSLSGLTEWISVDEPTISVGWDWRANLHSEGRTLERISNFRTNLMAVNGDGHDIKISTVTETLVVVFRRSMWEPAVIKALGL